MKMWSSQDHFSLLLCHNESHVFWACSVHFHLLLKPVQHSTCRVKVQHCLVPHPCDFTVCFDEGYSFWGFSFVLLSFFIVFCNRWGHERTSAVIRHEFISGSTVEVRQQSLWNCSWIVPSLYACLRLMCNFITCVNKWLQMIRLLLPLHHT